MIVWTGGLQHGKDSSVNDIRLSSHEAIQLLNPDATLSFLSIVHTGLIPLSLWCSPLFDVRTSDPHTLSWFDSLLCGDDLDSASDGPWWATSRVESHVGILARVEQQRNPSRIGPHVTEILFFAAKSTAAQSPPTPPHSSSSQGEQHLTGPDQGNKARIEVRALLLSSGLLRSAIQSDLTPPSSPRKEDSDKIQAAWLPSVPQSSSAVLPHKRKLISETFDEASKRRRQYKKNVGGSVAAAASLHSQIQHHRTASTTSQQSQALSRPQSQGQTQHKALSRTSSLQLTKSRSQSPAPTRPPTADAATTKQTNPSEQKNRDLISRLILAGMRLHGLSQSKSKSTAKKTPEQQRQDDDFKLVYHNTLKAITFSFRAHIGAKSLVEHTDLLRDSVDRLLGMFCADPLAVADRVEDEETGSGRTPFKTPLMQGSEGEAFPFPTSAEKRATGSVAGTPPQHTAIWGDVDLGLGDTGKGKAPAIVQLTPVRRRREPGF